jgi:hypothetical protein
MENPSAMRQKRTIPALLAAAALIAPVVACGAVTIHVASEHGRGAWDSLGVLEVALHGHRHSSGTSDHEHQVASPTRLAAVGRSFAFLSVSSVHWMDAVFGVPVGSDRCRMTPESPALGPPLPSKVAVLRV